MAAGLAWALVLVAAPAPQFEPSAELQAAWAAEEGALERGDLDAAVEAVVDAWTLPDAPADLRERVAAMQRRAFELQTAAPAVSEAPDPLESGGMSPGEVLAQLEVPSLVVAGGRDMPDFVDSARELAATLPAAEHVTVAAARHLVPLEEPAEFRRLLVDFLDRHRP
jgi:pimeloyl-ACP methyl ester carboxylesterase